MCICLYVYISNFTYGDARKVFLVIKNEFSLSLSLSLSLCLSLSLFDHHLQLFPSSSTNTCITHTSLEGHSKSRELDIIASISTKFKEELTNLFRKKIKKSK